VREIKRLIEEKIIVFTKSFGGLIAREDRTCEKIEPWAAVNEC
jgi:hypothetical protein